jgi:hypothetical protein
MATTSSQWTTTVSKHFTNKNDAKALINFYKHTPEVSAVIQKQYKNNPRVYSTRLINRIQDFLKYKLECSDLNYTDLFEKQDKVLELFRLQCDLYLHVCYESEDDGYSNDTHSVLASLPFKFEKHETFHTMTIANWYDSSFDDYFINKYWKYPGRTTRQKRLITSLPILLCMRLISGTQRYGVYDYQESYDLNQTRDVSHYLGDELKSMYTDPVYELCTVLAKDSSTYLVVFKKNGIWWRQTATDKAPIHCGSEYPIVKQHPILVCYRCRDRRVRLENGVSDYNLQIKRTEAFSDIILVGE